MDTGRRAGFVQGAVPCLVVVHSNPVPSHAGDHNPASYFVVLRYDLTDRLREFPWADDVELRSKELHGSTTGPGKSRTFLVVQAKADLHRGIPAVYIVCTVDLRQALVCEQARHEI